MSTSQDDVTAVTIDAASVQDIPVKPVPDLPISNSGAFDIVAVVNNKDTVRVSWESLTANHIQQTGDVPVAPGAVDGISAPYLTLAADGTGLYVSDGTEWRKIATYGANWDDIGTDDTRFLPVNKTITLTPSERANALTSLDIGTATTAKEGLVRIPEDSIKGVGIENGELYVRLADPINENNIDGTPGIVYIKDFYDGYDENDADSTISSRCAVTERYVDQAINSRRVSVPFASYTQSGTVQIAEGTALIVDSENGGLLSIKTATEAENGVVRIHNIYDASGNPIDPIATSKGYVDQLVRESVVATPATDEVLGMVKVEPTSSITINSSGAIDVKYATTATHGTVVLSDAISDTADYSEATVGVAATPKAVKDYVTYKTMSMDIPVASASRLGGVIIGEGIFVTGEGVISIQNATENHIGGVRVVQAEGDTSYTVPTLKKVEEMVAIDIPKTEIATETVYGTVKLSKSRIIDPYALKIGFNNNNQLVAEPPAYPGEGEDSFKLSSTNVINFTSNIGLPIAADATRAIYVDASNSNSQATTVRPGLVMLSVSRSEVLPTTNPGIGVDANGQLRVKGSISGGGSSSTSEFNYYFYKKDEPSVATFSPIYYYTSDTFRMPFVPAASSSKPGVVLLGTATQVNGGVPVGVDETGRLFAAINTTGGGEGTYVGVATADSAGIVKLGQNDVISNGLRVGVNAEGQLCVASTSTDMTTATFEYAGAVTLSTPATYATGTFGVVGVDSTNGKLAVPSATSDDYGVVKVGGGVLDTSDPTVALIGHTAEGQLAVKGVSSGGDETQTYETPLHVTLIPAESSGSYIVTMTGGTIQLNDGTIVNIEAITEEDNIVVTLTNNQTLSLKVFINSDGEPIAKLTVNSSTKVLTCKPFIG